MRTLIVAAWTVLFVTASSAEPPKKALPLPGETFVVEGHTAFLILPPPGKAQDRPHAVGLVCPYPPQPPRQRGTVDV